MRGETHVPVLYRKAHKLTFVLNAEFTMEVPSDALN